MTESLLFGRKHNTARFLFLGTLLFLSTQLGKHFWPPFAFVLGQRVDYLSPTLYLSDIFLFLFLVSLRSSLWISRVGLVFLGSVAIGIFLSHNPLAGWYGFIKLIEFILFGYAVSHISWQRDAQAKRIMLGAGIFQSVLACTQYLLQHSVGGILYVLGERTFSAQTPGIANVSLHNELILRPYGTFSHPNVLAAFLLISFIFTVSLWEQQKKRHMLFLLGLGIVGFAVLLTMSRVVILLLLLFLVGKMVLWVKTNTLSFQQFVRGGMVAVLIVCATLLVVGIRFEQSHLTEAAVVERTIYVQQAYVQFVSSPLFGVGLNNYWNHLPSHSPFLTGLTALQPVHNIFFLLLAQTGLVGTALALWFLYTTARHLYTLHIVRRDSFELWFLLATAITLGFVDHYFATQQQGQLLFAYILGYLWSPKNRYS